MLSLFFFFFNDTATTEIYTLSLHDALPISRRRSTAARRRPGSLRPGRCTCRTRDRKSTRLNSSHVEISYAVFCLKKKKTDDHYGNRPKETIAFSSVPNTDARTLAAERLDVS